ncbi:MAG: hypothetical protein KY469_15770 [Actinobacteria bacterium]|nr:hypothetical protein [Actinomycetota bacterium]
MSPRGITALIALGRAAIGATLLAAPQQSGKGWLGDVADDPRAQAALRGLGARDLAIGIGTLLSLTRGRRPDRWIEAGIIADGADAFAAVMARDRLARTSLVTTIAVAGGAALLGLYTRFASVGPTE